MQREEEPSLVTNIMSVDVEDYFHVEAFADRVDRGRWDAYPSRVEANTLRLLDLLEELGVEATFFILGWVAERHPGLVREIVARGHEPACHSYWHRLIYRLEPREFAEDTRRAKDVIEQAAGMAVTGYRSPSYSITARSLWRWRCWPRPDSPMTRASSRSAMTSTGSRPRRGIRFAWPPPPGPWSSTRSARSASWAGRTCRWAAAATCGSCPSGTHRLGAARVARERLPLVAYIHPWEIDPGQPRLAGRLRSRIRHYTNLSKTEHRLRRLLQLGDFTSFRRGGLEVADGELTPNARTFFDD